MRQAASRRKGVAEMWFRAPRSEAGAVAVEFAILLPIFATMLFALIAFGLGLSRLESYTSAAREGARYVAVRCVPDHTDNCTADYVRDVVVAASTPAGGIPNPISVDIENTPTLDCRVAPRQKITVSWDQPIDIDLGFFHLSATAPISGSFLCE
jgi:Flp pilus assembly protein TadG